MTNDVERTLICEVCGADARCGSGVSVDGIRMGDMGSWRCAEHHPDRQPRSSREQWAQARAEGRLYPGSELGEWQKLGDIMNRLLDKLAAAAPPKPTTEAAE